MKRVDNLFIKLISDENLLQAITDVNKGHRWRPHHKPNKTTLWVEKNKNQCVKLLREIIVNGFVASPCMMKRRWDKSSEKWRNIYEPKLWPDQYIHHAIIQVLQPVMMRGMDKWCCGSIKKRGIHYGGNTLKLWMKEDRVGTAYCAELDIHHFYDSINPEEVMKRFRRIVKDPKVMDLIWRIIKDGVMIGNYTSQWFANTLLQPLDQMIHDSGLSTHYMRYMDNLTIFSDSKEKLHELVKLISQWLGSVGLELKDNWQVFPTSSRLPTALGYRFGHGFTQLRKRNRHRLVKYLNKLYRKLRKGKKIPWRFAAGLISRLGQLTHCNSHNLNQAYVVEGVPRLLKAVVRNHSRREQVSWNMYLEQVA